MLYLIKYYDNHHSVPLYVSAVEYHQKRTKFHGKTNIRFVIKYKNLHKARIALAYIKRSIAYPYSKYRREQGIHICNML